MDSNEITLETEVVAVEEQVCSELAGESVVLNLKSGTYYTLNPIATQIWTHLQQPVRISELRARLLEEYDVTPEECQKDLVALLQELKAYRLIETR